MYVYNVYLHETKYLYKMNKYEMYLRDTNLNIFTEHFDHFVDTVIETTSLE